MDKYVLVSFPEIQDFMVHKRWGECIFCQEIEGHPDPDPDDWFNDDDEKAFCKEANKLIEGMLRPYEEVLIPDWCPLKTSK